MKLKLYVVLLVGILSTMSLFASNYEKCNSFLQEAIEKSVSSKDKFPIIVIMKDQYDTQNLYQQVKELRADQRRDYSMSVLKSFSEVSQRDIRSLLDKLAKEKKVFSVHYFWAWNAVSLETTKEIIDIIQERGDVEQIAYDPESYALIGDCNPSSTNVEHTSNDGSEREIPYNLIKLKVPEVWNLGFKGEGVVVAVLDTGVNYNHEDLKNRMWINPDYPSHGYNFTNDSMDTMDDNGHGTHTAGTVAGDGTAGTQTGVAPLSKIMALKVLTREGTGQQSGVWKAMEFAAEKGAHVLSMSIGWEYGSGAVREVWRGILENFLNLGITASVAVGNEGNQQFKYPTPYNVRTPGDCPTSWIHPSQTVVGGITAAVGVGATDQNDQVAVYSSRGPVTWQEVEGYKDYPWRPGNGLMKPDVTSPGTDVRSLSYRDTSGYLSLSGTSMAAPSVAGIMALMISKDRGIIPEEISQILQETARNMNGNKDNNFGAGIANALQAITEVVPNRPPNQPRQHYPTNGEIEVPVNLTFEWYNGGGAEDYYISVGTDNPPTNIINRVKVEGTSYKLSIELGRETDYFWRVDAENKNGEAEGAIWTFKTEPPISEGFERGDFTKYDWQLASNGGENSKWLVTSDESFSGSYSARSGVSGNNVSTVLWVTVNVLEDGKLKFYRKTSSEGFDQLKFYIDNQLMGEWSGENDWTKEVYEVKAGSRTFKWSYIKDTMGAQGQDAVWIDEITFPPHPAPMTYFAPNSFTVTPDFETNELAWELEENNKIDPELFEFLGFDVYYSYDRGSFNKLNKSPLFDKKYSHQFNKEGEYTYYVKAKYRMIDDIIESAPSEEKKVTVYPALSNPVFTPPAGSYSSVINIKMTSDEGATIFYTVDTAEPNLKSFVYDKPYSARESFVLKAKAYKKGYLSSGISMAGYNIVVSAEDTVDLLPSVADLRVYPNPFHQNMDASRSAQGLTVEYYVPADSRVIDVSVFNIKGQLVESLISESAVNGKHSIVWSFGQNGQSKVNSGVYFIRLQTDKEIITKRAMILK